MPTTSTIPDVSDALVAALRAAIPAGVDVFDGRPANNTIGRQVVFLGDIDSDDNVPTSRAGRASRDERYTVDVVIFVSLPRGTQAVAKRRAYELRAVVENVLANNKTCTAVPNVAHWTAAGHRCSTGLNSEGPFVVITQAVEVYARLQGDAP